MDKQQRLAIYAECEKKWGKIAQYDQCIEEMAELTIAINKVKRKTLYGEYIDRPEIEDNLVEEVADVVMCLEQIIGWIGEDVVSQKLDQKLNKLIQHMKKY